MDEACGECPQANKLLIFGLVASASMVVMLVVFRVVVVAVVSLSGMAGIRVTFPSNF